MSHKRLEILIVVLIFTILGFIWTYPLISHFTKALPYTHSPAKGYEIVPLMQGDYLQLYYNLWLFKNAAGGNTPFFSDPYQFSVGKEERFSTQFFPLSFFFLIFSVGGNIFAYNSLIILSFTFAGLAMYLLVKFYTKNKFSAFLGGTIFALAPFRVAQLLGGHPNGFLFFLIPLSIYFLELSLLQEISQSKRIKYGIFSGLCIFSLALMELHLVYYTFFFLTALILLKIFFLTENKKLWKNLFPILLFMLFASLWIFFTKQEGLKGSLAAGGRGLSEIKLFSPTVKDIFKRINDCERYIYLGIGPVLLAIFGFFSLFKAKRKEHSRSILIFYIFIFLITFILSLGPSLNHIFPFYQFCYKYVPYFNYPRVTSRIIVLSFLSLSILAGYGVKNFKKRIIFPLLLLGILIDYHPFKTTGLSIATPENKVYTFVQENIGNYKLLEIPLWPGDTAWSSLYLYYITHTRAKIINGYCPGVSKEYVTKIFHPLYNLNLGEMRKKEYELLKKLKVRYIIMHEEAFPPKVSPYPFYFSLNNLEKSRYVKFIKYDDPVWLFELLDKPFESVAQTFSQSCLIGKVYEAERLPRRVGTVKSDLEASGGYAVFGDVLKDGEDHLVFGPFRAFPTGKYKVNFRLKVDSSIKGKVAQIEVVTNKGQSILAERIIKGEDFKKLNIYQDFTLFFTQNTLQRLEFRVYFPKKVNLWVDYIYLLFADQKDPQLFYEAEELFHIARVQPDAQASAGQSLFADIEKDPPDYLIRGPYRKYPKGVYTASFRLKVNELLAEEIARLEITGKGRKILASKTIRGTDFEKGNRYQSFDLSFSLDKSTILEFLVYFKKKTNLWVDSIENTIISP